MKASVGSEPLRIWVLPVGDGDSIVVRLPDGTWGIIDSRFRIGTEEPAAWPILERQMLPNAEILRFACVTHYHHDHFLGMSELLERTQHLCCADGEFFHVGFEFAAVLLPHWTGTPKMRVIEKQFSPSTGVSPHPLRERAVREAHPSIELATDVRLEFLSPTTDCLKSFWRSAVRAAKNDRPEPDCFNRIGIAFRLTYGDSQILFTDDIEDAAWKRIEERYPDLAPRWTMVSHHGARTNNPQRIWNWLAAGRRIEDIHAVISANGRTHPNGNVVREVEQKFTVHKTWEKRKPVKPHSTLDVITGAEPAFTRRGTLDDAWVAGAYPGGQVCEFEVYPDGRVEVVS